MRILKTYFNDVFLIGLDKYSDKRGYFIETFNSKKFQKLINKRISFVQDNLSYSKFNVFRGLHFQKKPYSQSKLVSVIKGEILDVIVNIDPKSKFYKQYKLINLNEKKPELLFIPKHYAHGFYVLSNFAIFSYKVDKFRNINNEKVIFYKDKTISLKLPFKNPILNQRDSDEKQTFKII